jgi:hypothetical protein
VSARPCPGYSTGVSDAEPRADGRLAISLRIGVTGHRWLDPHDAALGSAARSVVSQLREACTVKSTASTEVGVTVISSLAEGADRIVAEAAMALGARLEVVLPLHPDDLVSDFSDDSSRAHFHRLLAAADSVVVASGGFRPHAYRVSGELVLQRCDVLIAMWDGRPANGIGGTAEVVDASGAMERPWAWIEVARPESGRQPVARRVPPRIDLVSRAAFDSLDRYNGQVIGIDTRPRAPDGFARSGEIASLLLPYFIRADRVATRQQSLSRFVSILLYVLSVIAICMPALQLVYFDEQQDLLSWVEVFALFAIIGLLALGRRMLLLERWLASRYLAERLRSLAFLAELSATDALQTRSTDAQIELTASDEWRERAVSELALRMPRPVIDPSVLFRTASTRLVDEWFRPQISYHTQLKVSAERRSRQLKCIAIALFALSVTAALAHLADVHITRHSDAVFLALSAPTVAAALSGYSAQRDYPRLAMTSQRMVHSLTVAIADIENATSVDELRDVAGRVDIVLQGESLDWYAAARLRAPEVP